MVLSFNTCLACLCAAGPVLGSGGTAMHRTHTKSCPTRLTGRGFLPTPEEGQGWSHSMKALGWPEPGLPW